MKKVDKQPTVVPAELSYVVVGFNHGTGEFDLLGTTVVPEQFIHTCGSTLKNLFNGQFSKGELVRIPVPDDLKNLGVCIRYDLLDYLKYPADRDSPALLLLDGAGEQYTGSAMSSWNSTDTSVAYSWILVASQAGVHSRIPFSKLEAMFG